MTDTESDEPTDPHAVMERTLCELLVRFERAGIIRILPSDFEEGIRNGTARLLMPVPPN